jgi:hypothetical protein
MSATAVNADDRPDEVAGATHAEALESTPARGHIDRPAALVTFICTQFNVPCSPNATDALTEFLVCGLPQLYSTNSKWEARVAVSFVTTAVFPREAVPFLAEICRKHGVTLMRSKGLAAFNFKTGESAIFDHRPVVEAMIDTIPDAEDVYTFGIRTNGQRFPTICALDTT